ncbi:calcium-binding protein [Microvirga sp. 2YAF29]|uniref:calcium-binding protein n=1 Tax=Microvirga sp. 2YAF29 TaxID=3233031 RepID=UPI003F9BE62D
MPTKYDELGVVILDAGDTDFALTAADGAFNVLGNADDNEITGNAFNNVLDGNAGADTLIGGAGDDTYVIDDADDVVTELANEGTDTIRSNVSFAMTTAGAAFVENLVLLGAALEGRGNALNNSITGNDGANVLYGMSGDDVLFGGAGGDDLIGGEGNDFLDGGTGDDDMTGGFGNDTYVVDSAGDVITEAANAGTDTVQASITYSIAAQANLENIVLTGTGNINATGNAGDNSLIGNSGVNVLIGGGGNDSFDGGAGADRLDGGDGNDTYMIDSAGDAIVDSSGVDTVVSFLANYTLGAGLENATVGGTGAFNLTGNEVGNLLTGNSGANILDGGAGVDTMTGGLGNDTYLVDNTLDVINESAGGGIDTVRVSTSYSLSAASEVEFLISGTNASVRLGGSEFANTIVGGNGRDVLFGLGGDDVLDGGRGRDDLRGGAGKDYFKFDDRPTRSTVDRVLDFNTRDDFVLLDNAIFTKLGRGTEEALGKLNAAFFRIGDRALDLNDYLIYNPVTDDLIYDSNGSRPGGTMKIADFNNIRLSAADILIT